MITLKNVLIGLGTLIVVSLTYIILRYKSWKNKRIQELTAVSDVIDTTSGSIEYRMSGSGEAVMLFLHGAPGGYDQYQPSPELALAPYRVLSLSRPGYLQTPLETGQTPAQQATAYAALLDALDIEKVIVMAASGGGPSGIAFAAMYPERTIGLITMAAVSQPMAIDSDESKPAIAVLLQGDFLNWLAMGLLTRKDEWLVGMMVTGADNQSRILQDPHRLSMLRGAVLTSQPPSLRQLGFKNDAEQLLQLELPIDSIRSVPTMVIHGTEDANVPFAFSEELARKIPDAQFEIFEGADHYLRFSHKEKFDRVVGSFIAKLLQSP